MIIIANVVLFLILALPVFKAFRNYPLYVHKIAAWKAFFLWCVSTSPVIAAILLSSPKEHTGDDQTTAGQFIGEILSAFTISEMFVYTAAFIAPMLYVVFDFIKKLKEEEVQLKRQDIEEEMRGMEGIFLSAIGLIIVTLMAYASHKSDPDAFSSTYLSSFLTGRGYLVYILSLLIWYSVILWETLPKDKFVKKQAKQTRDFADDYAKRRGGQA